MVDVKQKLLTIIVPSYNMEQYLPKCLGSLIVAPKLMERLEVLVVNDGSKDRTSEIAHEFAAKWPGTFKVIDKPNGHYGSCINAALPMATGKYVRLLDADDYAITEEFSGYLKWVDGVDVDFAFNDWEYVDPDDAPFYHTGYPVPTDRVFAPNEIPVKRTLVGVHAIAYRTEILRRMNYRQTEGIAYTDMEWFLLPMSQVRTVRHYPHKVFRYLLGRSDQSVNCNEMQRNLWMFGRVLERIVRDYPAVCEAALPTAINYFKERIEDGVSFFYCKAIYAFEQKDPRFDLVAFDDLLKRNAPAVYAMTDAVRISRWVRLRIVHEWRKGYTVKTWRFRLLKHYKAAIKKLQR